MTILLRQKPLPQVVRQIVQRDNGAWFDTEDMSTMFQDAAGTTPVTALEQLVGLWLDKSGNGNHATQSITASRPTLSARYNLLTKSDPDAAVPAGWAIGYGTGTYTHTLIDNFGGLPTSHKATKHEQTISGRSYLRQRITMPTGIPITVSVFVDLSRSYVTAGDTVVLSLIGTSFVNRTLADAVQLPGYPNIGVITATENSLDTKTELRIGIGSSNNATGVLYYEAPQINIGSSPLQYQRVNTATDYDSVGWPRYLRGEGVDDFYNLPFMNLYGNGACSIVAARDAVSQSTDTYIISERSTTDVDPKYFPSRQLASGGNIDSYIVSDEGTVRLDTTGSAFSGAKLAAIRSVVDSGSNIKLFKDGAVVADDNYTRAGTLTLNNTTLGASVSTTTSNYANMRLYGIIVTKSALSDTDRRRCEQFLASRLTSLGVTLS